MIQIKPTLGTVQLLVSVRNLAETEKALAAGVDWIDLKDPASGPLGAPDIAMARQVSRVLVAHPQRSVALGELADLDQAYAMELAAFFPVLKLGLSNQNERSNWQQQLQDLTAMFVQHRATLVPVIYADWRCCAAPSPQDIVRYCKQARPDYVLFDTYMKQGKSLFDWLNVDELVSLVRELAQFDARVVLAGSLAESDLLQLASVPCAAVGIRGAVCPGGRESAICSKKLSAWVSHFCAP